MLRKISVCALMACGAISYAQTGPAGVGDASSNKIWLDASYIAGLSDGSAVSTWPDRSGNDWSAEQNSAASQPTYLPAGLNARAIIHFDRTITPQFLQISRTNMGTVLSNSHTLFTVARANSGGTTPAGGEGWWQVVFCSGGWLSGIFFDGYPNLRNHAPVQWIGGDGSSPSTSQSVYVATSPLSWHIMTKWNKETAAGTTLKGFSNGALKGTKTSTLLIADYTAIDVARIGANAASGYRAALNGDIAEIILFNRELNDAERIIVDNYLSSKYGLSIANDFYNGHETSYTIDVQGIGTTNATVASKNPMAANSRGLCMTELNNSLNASMEFVFSGHASPTNNIVGDDLPSGVENRWQRTWYLKKTGNVDAKLSFDFSDAGVAPATTIQNGLANYRLLYRASLSSPFAIVSDANGVLLPVLENGDQVAFPLTNSQLQSGYYTLGSSNGYTYYAIADGAWSEPGTWSLTEGGPPSSQIPTSMDAVSIDSHDVIVNPHTILRA